MLQACIDANDRLKEASLCPDTFETRSLECTSASQYIPFTVAAAQCIYCPNALPDLRRSLCISGHVDSNGQHNSPIQGFQDTCNLYSHKNM